MSWIAKIEDSLDGHRQGFGLEALAEVLPQAWILEALEACGTKTLRRRRLPCEMTIWLIVLLGIFRRHSYLNLLEMLRGSRWAGLHWPGAAAPCSSALSKARDRVGIAPLAWLFRHSARAWVDAGGGLFFYGRRVCALDGSTFKIWDSDENRSCFGVPGASRGTTAFPQVRVVGCLDIGTRLVEAACFGPYRRAELRLAEELLPDLQPGSLLLLDRNFAAYGFLWDLHQQGVDFLVRIKHNMKGSRIRELGPGDAWVQIPVPRQLRRSRPELPATWLLREVTVALGPTAEPRRFLTSLLDPSIPGAEIAALYLRRWDQETALDEIKTHLGGATTVNRPLILRSRKPDRVGQEIYGLLIAYNAVRRLTVLAAAPRAIDPLRISFTAALFRLREAIYDMMRLPASRLPDRYADLLRAIRRIRVPERPGRAYPRAVRIKMSPYPLNRRRHAG